MKEQILQELDLCVRAVEQLQQPGHLEFIEQSSLLIAECYQNEGQLILAGNGGSLCDAAHFAEELTGQFRKRRPALPAIVLNEPGFLTCAANDFGFEQVFARGVEAYGRSGDIFIGLTTSGNSINIIKAFELAKKKQLKTIALLGKGGGQLKGVADLEMIIDGFSTSDRIQEAHMCAIHIMIQMVEQKLFYDVDAPFAENLSHSYCVKS